MSNFKDKINRFKTGLSTWKEIRDLALLILTGIILFLILLGLNELIDKKWFSDLMFDFGTVIITAIAIATIFLIYELIAKFYQFIKSSEKREAFRNQYFIQYKSWQIIGIFALFFLMGVVIVFTVIGIIEIFKQ